MIINESTLQRLEKLFEITMTDVNKGLEERRKKLTAVQDNVASPLVRGMQLRADRRAAKDTETKFYPGGKK